MEYDTATDNTGDRTDGTPFITALSCDLSDTTIQVQLTPRSRMHAVYDGADVVEERTTCNYGLDPAHQTALHDSGLRVVGTDDTGEARLVDLDGHPFFAGSLYLPQFITPTAPPHPLLRAFVQAAATR